MDKSKKLKSYSDKNYSEVVTFPVELVGRDGVVRRYSYEDSIRIYRRRIDSAHLRYQDKDIISAEVYHCTRRMEQIQRSWRQRIHRSEQRYIAHCPDPAILRSYEQGKAFVESYVGGLPLGHGGGGEEESPNLVQLTEIPSCRVFFVNYPGFRAGTLLYVFDLSDDEGAGQARYDAYLNLLRTQALGPDVEKRIHDSTADDYGFILTNPNPDILVSDADLSGVSGLPGGRGDGVEAVVKDRGSFLLWLEEVLREAGDSESGDIQEILQNMRGGDLDYAFDLCRRATEISPYNRRAYWIMGALSEILGRWVETEPYMIMACHYFPEDAQSHLLAGLHQLRMGEPKRAVKSLELARELNPDLPCLHALLVRAYAAGRDLSRARRLLQEGMALHPQDGELQVLERNFRELESWHRWSLIVATAVTLLGIGLTLTYSSYQGLTVLGVFAALVAIFLVYRHRSREWFSALD